MRLPRLSPVLGAPQPGILTDGRGYDSAMTVTDPHAARLSLLPTIEVLSAPPTTARLPWSVATVIGWSALVVGTFVTIGIVLVAVTLP